jgi:hypothetical protein
MKPTISELWHSADPNDWADALERYWSFVLPRNRDLEHYLDDLDLERLRSLDARGWYSFLHNEYFRWKYTAANRYATTTSSLRFYQKDQHSLDELDQVRQKLLALDTDDIRSALEVAHRIRGLGPSGASGLLALMYPHKFGTCDQFVVKALGQIDGLPEAPVLSRMKPEDLTIPDGVAIINLLRRKAVDTNRVFNSDSWTPRKIDKVLWTYGRH